MSAIERMTITMPAEMAAALRKTVAGGEYASISGVFREALREWARARDIEWRDLESLPKAITMGWIAVPAVRPRMSLLSCARAPLRRTDPGAL